MQRETYILRKGRYVLSNNINQNSNQNLEQRKIITSKLRKVEMFSNILKAPLKKCKKFLKVVAVLFLISLLILLGMAAFWYLRHRNHGRRNYERSTNQRFEAKGMKLKKFGDNDFERHYGHHCHHGHHHGHPKRNPSWFNCTITNFNETNHNTDLSCELISKKKEDREYLINFGKKKESFNSDNYKDLKHKNMEKHNSHGSKSSSGSSEDNDSPVSHLKKEESHEESHEETPKKPEDKKDFLGTPLDNPKKPEDKKEMLKNPEEKKDLLKKPLETPKKQNNLEKSDLNKIANEKRQLLPLIMQKIHRHKRRHHNRPLWVVIDNQKFMLVKPNPNWWRKKRDWRRHHHFCPFLFMMRIAHILGFILIVGLIARCCKKRKMKKVLRRKINRFVNLENQDVSGITLRVITPREIEVEFRNGNGNNVNTTQIDNSNSRIQINPNPVQRNDREIQDNYYNVNLPRQNESLISRGQNSFNRGFNNQKN